ncbi:MAG TPA: Gfo/Idh/MocA family oxidoreductase [Candidatus Brocadiia bacterium]|nr:Gfo/Idh/MocA family oxidoreductase [Candidatus Brocadiia bacterium]
MKLAILGFAHGHVNAYADEIRKMNDAEVAWGWDHDPARAAQQCKAVGCECVPDLGGLLAKKDLGGVMIGSETSKHADIVVAAARAGKTILLQKPMALTLQDCDRMIEAVRSAGVRFSMAWQMRCDPQNAWMRDAILSGKIGRVVMLRRRHGLATHKWPDFDKSWHVAPELNRGMFMDDASHPADLLLWILGKPTSVIAEIDTLVNPKIPDDNGVAVYRFKDGALGILECSFTQVAAEDTTTIVGTEGTIAQAFGDGPSCSVVPTPPGTKGLKFILAGQSQWTQVDIPTPSNHGDRIRGVARPAVEFFLGKRGPIATDEEGRINIQMLLAAYDSAAGGKRVAID